MITHDNSWQQELLKHTNGGLEIILSLYPEAHKAVDRKGTKFKLRGDEKTASASLKQMEDGNWIVTDFGGDQKNRNAIHCWSVEKGIDFTEALKQLRAKYGLSTDSYFAEKPKPNIKKYKADGQDEKWYDLRQKQSFTDSELASLFSERILKDKTCNYERLRTVCHKYNLVSVDSIAYCKEGNIIEKQSTEEYPIFAYVEKEWVKLYEPKAEKQFRFRYFGSKPKKYIHGLQNLQKEIDRLQKSNEGFEDLDDEGDPEEKKPTKVDEVIYCTGGSDALNVAALGYHVIWLNSESESLDHAEYANLSRMATKIYSLPDLDKTGQRTNHELCLKYLDIHTIELPKELLNKYDWRGNPCKDVRDFFNHYNRRDFDDCMRVALPYRFWDPEPEFNKKGDFKKWGYRFNNLQCYNFLNKNGFWRFKSDNAKESYIYIRITGNIVTEIEANDIKNFIHQFLQERKMDVDLRNTFYKSTQLSSTSLSNLPELEIDFSDFSKTDQYLFFLNTTWRISKDGIEQFKPGAVDKFVWEDEVIKHRVELNEPPFVIKQDAETGEYDIEIHNSESLFFKYLINTSRNHWHKELEQELPKLTVEERQAYLSKYSHSIDGPLLSAEEIQEQKMHLINKIYSLGYLMHRYKDPSRPWCVFAMDNKMGEEGESNGGSGKSIAYKAIRLFMKSVTLDGRNPRLTENPHIYERVTVHTDYILIDDANQYLKFNFFFAPLTGELTVNPKNNKQYEIPFKDVPKFCITSNYTVRDLDLSTERRLLYTVFSDYYHHNGQNNEYADSRTPKDDFGKILFDDFDSKDWLQFINFMAQCCRWYMNFEKIGPPMDNVTRRNLVGEMTHNFLAWADVYFSEESNNRDHMVAKSVALDTFCMETKSTWTTQKFTRSMIAWCKYRGFKLNPEDLRNKEGRIIRTVPIQRYDKSKNEWVMGEAKKSTEMIYVQTPGKDINDQKESLPF